MVTQRKAKELLNYKAAVRVGKTQWRKTIKQVRGYPALGYKKVKN